MSTTSGNPEPWREGTAPLPTEVPVVPAEGLDFEEAERKAQVAKAAVNEREAVGTVTAPKLFRDHLNTQHRAALARVREEYQGRIYVVEAVEWSHPSNDIPEGATRLIVKGVIQPVGAGDTILYRRLEVR